MSTWPTYRICGRRRIVVVVLAMWLFALGAGWAKACALEERSTHAHSGASADAAVVISVGHIGADSVHGDGVDAGDRACLKICDEATQSVVKKAASFELADAALAHLPAPLRPVRNFALRVVGAAMPAAARPAVGPPLRTQLSRLAL